MNDLNIVGQDLISLLPHRTPMVMIDKLVRLDEHSAMTQLQVRSDNVFYENNLLQLPALIENVAQTAAAQAGYYLRQKYQDKASAIGFIGSIKNLECFSLPALDETLTTEIQILKQIKGATIISGTVHSGGTLLLQCQMNIFIKEDEVA